jgi:hypothetical protein
MGMRAKLSLRAATFGRVPAAGRSIFSAHLAVGACCLAMSVAIFGCGKILDLDPVLPVYPPDDAAAYIPADSADDVPPNPLTASALYRVNCGCVVGCGIIGGFSPDNYYSGMSDRFGIDAAIDMSHVQDAAPMAIYQTYRYVNGLGNTFTYLFPDLTPGGHYDVRLHFADLFNDAAGQRAFNVVINQETVLTAFDIIAQAGAPLRALDRDFATAADDGGVIQIDFVASDLDSACVNGIEVWSE